MKTIKSKLYFMSISILIILLMLGIYSYFTTKHTADDVDDIVKYPELQALLGTKTIDHYTWVEDLVVNGILLNKGFSGQIDHTKCGLGEWYYSYKPPKELEESFKKIEEPHKKFHATAPKILEAMKSGNVELAKKIYEEETKPYLNQTHEALTEMRLSVKKFIENKGKKIDDSQHGLLWISSVLYIALIIIFGILPILFIVKPIERGISKINSEVQRASEGDLNCEFDLTSQDEIGKIAGELRKMCGKLKEMIREVKESADQIASASEELSASSDQMSKGIVEQSGRAQQIATASAEMSQTIIDIAKNASNIANLASQSMKLAKDGGEVVNQSTKEVTQIAETVNNSAKIVEMLGEKSKQIGDIVNVIKDIADQTNLLALNAAIEAARAGEQGRGFAVVADEVRKLAERTGKATSEIGEMIGAIQNEVNKAVVSMEEGTKRVEVGVQYSNKTKEALEKIVASVEDLTGMVQQIATATEEMSSVSEQISNDVETIANVARESSSASEQVSQSSSSLAQLATRLSELIKQFKV